MTLQSLMHVRTNGEGVVSRRSFLRNVAGGAAAAGLLGWADNVTVHAEELRKRGMSVVVLFLRGGPSQFETFDPKPGSKNGGPTKAIDTAVKGIQVAEHWPNTAKAMKDIALVRSVSSREGEHQRATYQMQTGYLPAGGLKHPHLGAVVSSQIAPKEFDLPHFVSIGGRLGGIGSAFLGMRYAPFVVNNPNQMPQNTELVRSVSERRFKDRVALMKDLEEDYAQNGAYPLVKDHQAVYESASQMVLSPELKAFDLSKEKASTRDAYGRNNFGQGCLLARRLVQAGVTFAQIDSNGWDTHQDNFERCKTLSAPVDQGFAALVTDLREQGLLEKTLVVVMGEFGRTPRINGNTGRDHYPVCFSVALAGGGVKGGQVIGSSNADGTAVKERPVKVADLFCTFCHALKIDPRKENITTEGRPLKLVDGGSPVKELF